ncbi:hypothetical protein EE612_014561 [Oryza sativa]|nr:hypothetical protein EE612_014561 [Oryza sativa]
MEPPPQAGPSPAVRVLSRTPPPPASSSPPPPPPPPRPPTTASSPSASSAAGALPASPTGSWTPMCSPLVAPPGPSRAESGTTATGRRGWCSCTSLRRRRHLWRGRAIYGSCSSCSPFAM